MSNNERPINERIGSEQESPQEIVVRESKINETENILEYLFSRDKQATYQVWSDNKELGNIVEEEDTYYSDRRFTPEPLIGLKEKKIMWDFIRNPSTDLNQIKKRQDLLESMKESGLSEQLTSYKNGSYLINQGIEGLFSLVTVNSYDEIPLIDAYRNGYQLLEDKVLTHLKEIKEGKAKLNKLVETLSEIDKPIIKEVKNLLEQDLESVKVFNNDYFLYENYDHEKTIYLNDMLYDHILHFGSIVEFSNIVAKDKYSRAEFDDTKPAEYIQGWNFIREKNGENPQVLNDSVKDNPITILCGTNMGGKSFHMEQNHYIQLLAQSIGFIPAEKGNFKVYDSFLYLDRASTKASHDLSAFGVEVSHWISALEKIKTNNKVFMCVDEGFSTTSAEDQYYLLMGVAEHLKKHQGKTLLSTHNELFIENYINDSKVGIYNFPFTVEDNAKIKYSHKLTEGVGDSRALEVAESMGLSKKLIELAKKNIEGIFERVTPKDNKEWRNIESYSEQERDQMKNEKYKSLFGEASTSKDKIFQLFSEDRDFKNYYSLPTGEEDENIRFGGWYLDSTDIRKFLIMRLITEGKKLKTQDIVERQKMFSELSKNDKYQEIKEMGDKIFYDLKFLPKIYNTHRNFLEFNTLLISDNPTLSFSKENLEYWNMILNLNKKVLSKDFPEEYNEFLVKVEKMKRLFDVLETYFDNQDIFEIEQIKQNDYNEEITDPEIIAKYLELAIGEPNMEKWEGKLTRLRIKEYVDWLETCDKTSWKKIFWSFNDEKHPFKELINRVMNGYGAIKIGDWGNDLNISSIKQTFEEIADKYETAEVREKWQNKICKQRIKELIDYLNDNDNDNDNDKYKRSLIDLFDNISRFQFQLNIEDIDITKEIKDLLDIEKSTNTRTNYDLVSNSIDDIYKKYNIKGIKENLPKVSIFDNDLKMIVPEIHFFSQYFKNKNMDRNCEYHNNWPDNLIISLFLEMAVEENYFEKFPQLLRSYDAVYLHQLANSFEIEVKKLTTPDPKELFDLFNIVYEEKVKDIFTDYENLEKSFQKILKRYQIENEDNMGIRNVEYILDNFKTTDIVTMKKVFSSFNKITNKYIPDIFYLGEGEEIEKEKFRKFCQKEIIDSGLNEKLGKMLVDLNGVQIKAGEFIRKYKIVFKDSLGKDRTEEEMREIRGGKLNSLKKEVLSKNQQAIYSLFESDWYREEKVKEINKLVLEAQSLGLFGHMINTEGYHQVEFNSDGLVDIKQMFSMFKPKVKQELNDAHFDQDEQVRLIAAANMSGKTFYLKALNMAILSGLNTGFVPAESATMPLFDILVYLDRVTANLDGNLSALGNEVELWKNLFSVLENDQKVFVTSFIDEAFSTTSPKYQASLVYAIVMETINQGQYMAIASHNHDVLNLLRNLEKEFIKAYTLKINFDDKGKVEFKHILRELKTGEKSFSEAIPVARTLGMPEEILQTAEKIRNKTINS